MLVWSVFAESHNDEYYSEQTWCIQYQITLYVLLYSIILYMIHLYTHVGATFVLIANQTQYDMQQACI